MQRALSVDMSQLTIREEDSAVSNQVHNSEQKLEPSANKRRQRVSVAKAPAAAVTYQAEEQRILSRKVCMNLGCLCVHITETPR